MLNIKETKGFISKIEDKGKYKTATVTTSKKDKDGKWAKMYWNARIVGIAYKAEVLDGARIELTSAVVEMNKVNDKYYTNLIVFDMKVLEQGKEQPKKSKVEEDAEELPF